MLFVPSNTEATARGPMGAGAESAVTGVSLRAIWVPSGKPIEPMHTCPSYRSTSEGLPKAVFLSKKNERYSPLALLWPQSCKVSPLPNTKSYIYFFKRCPFKGGTKKKTFFSQSEISNIITQSTRFPFIKNPFCPMR